MDRIKGTSSPRWFFGAPLIGVLFGFVANRFFPETIQWLAFLVYRISSGGEVPKALPQNTISILSALIGILLAVSVLAAWQLTRWAMHAWQRPVRREV